MNFKQRAEKNVDMRSVSPPHSSNLAPSGSSSRHYGFSYQRDTKASLARVRCSQIKFNSLSRDKRMSSANANQTAYCSSVSSVAHKRTVLPQDTVRQAILPSKSGQPNSCCRRLQSRFRSSSALPSKTTEAVLHSCLPNTQLFSPRFRPECAPNEPRTLAANIDPGTRSHLPQSNTVHALRQLLAKQPDNREVSESLRGRAAAMKRPAVTRCGSAQNQFVSNRNKDSEESGEFFHRRHCLPAEERMRGAQHVAAMRLAPGAQNERVFRSESVGPASQPDISHCVVPKLKIHEASKNVSLPSCRQSDLALADAGFELSCGDKAALFSNVKLQKPKRVLEPKELVEQQLSSISEIRRPVPASARGRCYSENMRRLSMGVNAQKSQLIASFSQTQTNQKLPLRPRRYPRSCSLERCSSVVGDTEQQLRSCPVCSEGTVLEVQKMQNFRQMVNERAQTRLKKFGGHSECFERASEDAGALNRSGLQRNNCIDVTLNAVKSASGNRNLPVHVSSPCSASTNYGLEETYASSFAFSVPVAAPETPAALSLPTLLPRTPSTFLGSERRSDRSGGARRRICSPVAQNDAELSSRHVTSPKPSEESGLNYQYPWAVLVNDGVTHSNNEEASLEKTENQSSASAKCEPPVCYLKYEELPPPPASLSHSVLKTSICQGLAAPEDMWKSHFDTLTRMQCLVKHDPCFLEKVILPEAAKLMIPCILSLRSAVCRNALLTIKHIVENKVAASNPSTLCPLVPPLLSRASLSGQRFLSGVALDVLQSLYSSKFFAGGELLEAVCVNSDAEQKNATLNSNKARLIKLCLSVVATSLKQPDGIGERSYTRATFRMADESDAHQESEKSENISKTDKQLLTIGHVKIFYVAATEKPLTQLLLTQIGICLHDRLSTTRKDAKQALDIVRTAYEETTNVRLPGSSTFVEWLERWRDEQYAKPWDAVFEEATNSVLNLTQSSKAENYNGVRFALRRHRNALQSLSQP